jgi:hypothetical protein
MDKNEIHPTMFTIGRVHGGCDAEERAAADSMQAARSSETSVSYHITTRRHKPHEDDSNVVKQFTKMRTRSSYLDATAFSCFGSTPPPPPQKMRESKSSDTLVS